MLSNYFKDFEKKFLKKSGKAVKAAQGKTAGKKKTPEKGPSAGIDPEKLRESLKGIIPRKFAIDAVRPLAGSGFSPDGADYIIYQEYCDDLLKLFNGSVPQELVYGTLFVVQKLDKKNLHEVLNRVTSVKKIDFFASDDGTRSATIPAFAVCASSSIPLPELKNDIINYYMTNNIDFSHEADVLMILDTGIVIKNWREKRSFIALETGRDSMMWFYVLLNEYLDVERDQALDLRKYIKSDVVYPEY